MLPHFFHHVSRSYYLRPAAEAAAKEGKCEIGDIRNGTYNGFNPENIDGKYTIDYIIVGSHTPVEAKYFTYCYERPAIPEKEIGEGFVSDHFAVFAEVEV